MPIPMPTRAEARKSLDKIIGKARVHFYKPIQVAEILYRDRVFGDINLGELETYRTKSKAWRDRITQRTLKRVCTSSAKYQDNLFDDNAIPTAVIVALGEENRRTNGAVENYIYQRFAQKHEQLANALRVCTETSRENFDVEKFLDAFRIEAGLKRSLDKIYEIVTYALFSALIEEMDLQVSVSVKETKVRSMMEFSDFSQKILRLEPTKLVDTEQAKVFRVGVTNAADRGLDMYSNWGPAIQIKHRQLDEELKEEIIESISSDRIIIVCKNIKEDLKEYRNRIQSIVTENELVAWYKKALRGGVSAALGENLLRKLRQEIALEFPSVGELPALLRERHYDEIHDPYWV